MGKEKKLAQKINKIDTDRIVRYFVKRTVPQGTEVSCLNYFKRIIKYYNHFPSLLMSLATYSIEFLLARID